MSNKSIAILGTVGVPSNYGGFETLAENLVRYHKAHNLSEKLTVCCSSKAYSEEEESYLSARLQYLPLQANGVSSFLYDLLGLLSAVWRRDDVLLQLGVSGALALPLIRLISRARILINVDGIEWKREKWNGLARLILRASEWAAVRFSHEVIADNQAIADYVSVTYGSDCHVIAYGGDHALRDANEVEAPAYLPHNYALALCRIEPENNVHVILEALEGLNMPLVFVGNWDNSKYGRELKARFSDSPNIFLLDPIYDPDLLYAVRERASIYLHGHSAGGTNPSLVEMMHFGVPILAHACSFNRHSTEGKACYFESSGELIEQLRNLTPEDARRIGVNMREIAQHKYNWDQIGRAYFELLVRA